MKLNPPFAISSRLAPAVQIGQNGYLSFDNGRFVIDLPDGSEYVIDDFHPGAGSDLQDQFGTILSFLSACAESRAYAFRRCGDAMQGENSDLFPAHVGEWAEEMSNELDMLRFDIEESDETLIEED